MNKCNPVKTCSCRFCKPNQKRRAALKKANRRFRRTGKNLQIKGKEEIPIISGGYIA